MNEKILKDFVENIDKYVPNINCTDRFTWLVDDLKDIVLNNGKPKWKQGDYYLDYIAKQLERKELSNDRDK